MERRISFKNLYLVGVISLGLIGLGVGSTFAMFTASAEISDPISLTSGLNYQDDVVDLVDMTISSNKVETATLNITNNTDKTLNYTSWYKTNNNNLQIGTVVSNGYSITGTIEPNASAQIIVSIRNRGTGVAKVTVGISASEDDIVVLDGITTLPTDPLPPYLNNYITNLYTSNKDDGTVTNNSIEYKYASSVNLMNDRLGSAETDIDGGNIRYYGASPSNFIDIGDRDSNNDPILWRIIGVFDGKAKVIRNESIGRYAWDTSASDVNEGNGINEWSQANVMKLLNPRYENSQDQICTYDSGTNTTTCNQNNGLVNNSLWWNSESGTCYNRQENSTTTCDFTNTGLSEEVKDLIVSNLWYLGGISWITERESFVNQAYTLERGNNVIVPGTNCSGSLCNDTVIRTTTWTGKVGLIYPSDYGYATDLNACTDNLYNYYNSLNCTDNDWLKTNYWQWTMSSVSTNTYGVWVVGSNGSFGYGVAGDVSGIRPVVYLKSNVVLESGTGTDIDPYVID